VIYKKFLSRKILSTIHFCKNDFFQQFNDFHPLINPFHIVCSSHRFYKSSAVVTAVALLFAVLGSNSLPVTVAVFVIVFGARVNVDKIGVTTIFTVTVLPLDILPRLHVIVLVPLQLP
jgi:hypothetical protein